MAWFSAALIVAAAFLAFCRGGYDRLYWIPVAILLALAIAAVAIAINRGLPFLAPRPLLVWPGLILLGWAAISIATSINRERALFETTRLLGFGLVYLTVAFAVPEHPWKKLIYVSIFALGALEAAYGIVVYLAGAPLLELAWLEVPFTGVRVTGSFLNHNHFAGLMEMTALLGLGLAAATRRRQGERRSAALSRRLLLVVLSGLPAAGLMLSLSRGGWISFAVGLAVFVALLAIRRRRALLGFAVGAALLFAVVAAVAVEIDARGLSERLDSLIVYLDEPEEMGELDRVSAWRSAARMIADYPLLGVGVGGFASAFPSYREPGALRNWNFAHNDYLQIAAETGVIGLLAFLVFAAAVLVKGLGAAASGGGGFLDRAAPGTVGAMAALLVHEGVDFNLMIPSNALIFVTLAGMVAGQGLPAASRPAGGSRRRWLEAAVVLALILFGADGVRRFAGEFQFVQGGRAAALGERAEALARFEAAIKIVPASSVYQRAAARAGLELFRAEGGRDPARVEAAISRLERAIALDPLYPFYYHEAAKALQELEPARGEGRRSPGTYYEQAASIDPNNPVFLAGLLDYRLSTDGRQGQWELFRKVIAAYPPALEDFGDRMLPNSLERARLSRELPRVAGARLAYARYLFRRGRHELAEVQVDEADRSELDRASAALLAAQVLLERGRSGDAEAALRQGLSHQRGSLELTLYLAKLREDAGDEAGAIRAYEDCLAYSPNDPLAHYYLGELGLRRGRSWLSRQHFETAAALGLPTEQYTIQTYANLARVMIDLNDLKAAREKVDEGLRFAPTHPGLLGLKREIETKTAWP